MPWCPVCKVEYRDGFTKCNECEIELVDKLEVSENEENEWRLLQDDKEAFLVSVKDEFEFNIIESKLGQAGIPVLKKHKETGGYLNIYMGMSPFGIDVYVPASLMPIAKGIIEVDESQDVSTEQELYSSATNEENIHDLKNDYDRTRRLKTWFILIFLSPGLIWFLVFIIDEIIRKLKW